MLTHSVHPIVNAYGHVEGTSTMFTTYSGLVEISGCNELLTKLLLYCDGTLNIEELITKFAGEYAAKDLLDLLSALLQKMVIVDGYHAYENFHAWSCNPMRFCYRISEHQL